jgi:ABC-2 type transport system permease protein
MTTPTDAIPEFSIGSGAEAAAEATRPFYWSLRRELWENRSVWIAPLAVAALALLGFAINAGSLAERTREVLLRHPDLLRSRIGAPYDMAALILIVTGMIVAAFYSLDALHGERRDRSILFWKSLPVSDRTTVLAKVSIPLVVIPLLIFAIIMTLHALMFVLSSAVLLAHGMSPAPVLVIWNPLVRAVILLYGLAALALWHAPLHAWFILVSGWARRAIVLWAVVPFLALSAVFRVGKASSDVCDLLVYRIVGVVNEAFAFVGGQVHSLAQLTPGRFLTRPGLWLGLALAALFLAAAVRVRRNREPI